MAEYGRCDDIISLVVNPSSMLPELPLDKLRYIKLEAQQYIEEYSRDIAINFIAGNFTNNKHLCTTVLSGKDDTAIKEILEKSINLIDEEIAARKKNGIPSF